MKSDVTGTNYSTLWSEATEENTSSAASSTYTTAETETGELVDI